MYHKKKRDRFIQDYLALFHHHYRIELMDSILCQIIVHKNCDDGEVKCADTLPLLSVRRFTFIVSSLCVE
jgi:hypothetical protein